MTLEEEPNSRYNARGGSCSPGLMDSVGAGEGEAGQSQAGQLYLQHTPSKTYKYSTPYSVITASKDFD